MTIHLFDMTYIDALTTRRNLLTVRRIQKSMRTLTFTSQPEVDTALDNGARWADDGAIEFP